MTLKRHLDMHFQKNNEYLRKQRGNRTIGRPSFVNGISEFTNAARGRRQAQSGQEQGEGGAGSGAAGSGANQVKGGLIDPKGQVIQTEDTIPYNAKDVSTNFSLYVNSPSATFARKALTLPLMKKKSPISL
jgi:hypothetical protein